MVMKRGERKWEERVKGKGGTGEIKVNRIN